MAKGRAMFVLDVYPPYQSVSTRRRFHSVTGHFGKNAHESIVGDVRFLSPIPTLLAHRVVLRRTEASYYRRQMFFFSGNLSYSFLNMF